MGVSLKTHIPENELSFSFYRFQKAITKNINFLHELPFVSDTKLLQK